MDFLKLEEWLRERGEPAFRKNQILSWIFQKNTLSFDKMTNLSGELRDGLALEFLLPSLHMVKKEEGLQTTKCLWQLFDGHFIESVEILAPNRRTICVSSQVGCSLGCAFCASGKKGLRRDLTAFEIVQQVLLSGSAPTNIVFMGMGEPLLNYENALSAIRLFSEQMQLSQRRISLSTAGIVENILLLAREKLQINLVISLHAASQAKRAKIMPIAKKYPLETLLAAAEEYFQVTGRDVAFEYVLLKGINDSPEDARALTTIMKRSHFSVNLIPYNPVAGSPYQSPDRETIEGFFNFLQDEKVVVTRRYAKGQSINAACGQLALHH